MVMFALLVNLEVVASEIEVLHWWTSGGEGRGAQLLQKEMEAQGYTWKDFAVAGGGGDSAMMVLKSRAVSGNPPTAAQIKGYDIQEWAKLGFLSRLDAIAESSHWDALLPPIVADLMKYQGHYVAVPINLHRVNWLWVNPAVFQKAGAMIPTTLDELFIAAEAIKAAGFIPIAHGRQPWQDATLFEVVAQATLSSDEYVKAFVDLDMAILSGHKMAQVFERFQKLGRYIDQKALGREWNAATNMVIHGEAAMQIMGDWAKGEFTEAGMVPGKDYLCVEAPGTGGKFSYNIDSFVFFKSYDALQTQGQMDLAKTILTTSFQSVFNFVKGSVPVRVDVPIDSFDDCSKASRKAFEQAMVTGHLLPSLSADMVTSSYVQGAIYDVVSNFLSDPKADPNGAALRLSRAIKAAM
jgi:glucose/mannose transport system substrate-binding protein